MINDTIRLGNQGRKPSRGHREIQRRRKLERALPDVRAVLDHASAEARETFRDRVAPLVACVVAEIAVLDRQTDATDSGVMRRYGRIIADALDLHDDPFRALSLWKAAATVPLQTFARRWAEHLARAERDSEGHHDHLKLVNLDVVSAALNLTRPRIRMIFGDEMCSLSPIRMTERTFTLEEQRDIRALAKRVGYSHQHIRDIALQLDPEDFCDRILRLELMIAPGLDKVRPNLTNSSDVALSRSRRRWAPGSKPGPKPRADTIDAQVKAIARHRHESPITIYRILAAYNAWLETPVTGESSVTMTVNSCHNDSEFAAVRLPDFKHISLASLPNELTIHGVTITDGLLIAIASLPRHRAADGGKKRVRHDYTDKALIIAWWEATRGETPTSAQIRQWAHRGYLNGYRNTAREWQHEMNLRAEEDATQAVTFPPVTMKRDVVTVAGPHPVSIPASLVERPPSIAQAA